jgi:hypothetical protein
VDELMIRVDAALYAAKNNGRNRVAVSENCQEDEAKSDDRCSLPNIVLNME